MKDPEKFAIELYISIRNQDNLEYAFESKLNPPYHAKQEYERLYSNFRNFEIPFEIKQNARATAIIQHKSKKDKNTCERILLNATRKDQYYGSFIHHKDLLNC